MALQQLDTQKSENLMVLEEFKCIKEDATVYKKIGPALIKQEVPEAKGNVEKRLDYITKEMERMEKFLKEQQEKEKKHKNAMVSLQQKFQEYAMALQQQQQQASVGAQ
ncbi:hypothetical protein MP638_001419 [Amoeboaphelidium occidentale]|nr:hypothetical protein MP638_001419 [Amoeboaphelidium occidentale]